MYYSIIFKDTFVVEQINDDLKEYLQRETYLKYDYDDILSVFVFRTNEELNISSYNIEIILQLSGYQKLKEIEFMKSLIVTGRQKGFKIERYYLRIIKDRHYLARFAITDIEYKYIINKLNLCKEIKIKNLKDILKTKNFHDLNGDEIIKISQINRYINAVNNIVNEKELRNLRNTINEEIKLLKE